MNVTDAKWYVVGTLVGQEHKAAAFIKDEAKRRELEAVFEEVLVPVENVRYMRRGKEVAGERKVLPGYLLIKMLMNDDGLNVIKENKHVTGFLGASHMPAPIPEDQVLSILGQIDHMSKLQETRALFEVGELVKIMGGAFEGFTAIIGDVDNEKSRLKVAVSIFNRETSLELPFEQVHKLS